MASMTCTRRERGTPLATEEPHGHLLGDRGPWIDRLAGVHVPGVGGPAHPGDGGSDHIAGADAYEPLPSQGFPCPIGTG